MAFTQQQYSDLVGAIAEGVLQVRFSDGRQISYRSLGEMMNLKTLMEEDLGVSGAGRRRHYASFRRD
jgi:hypothetical protein